MKRLALALGVLVGLWFLAWQPRSAWLDFPLDDAWIHLVYARSLWREGMPAYNPGVPEAGFSSATWIVLLAPLHALGTLLHAPPAIVAKLASLGCATFASVGLGRIAEHLGKTAVAGLATVALTMLSPAFGFSAVSAMEVCLTAALGAWGFVFLLRRRTLLAGVLLGLATMARLEAVLLLPAAMLLVWSLHPGERARRLLQLLAPAALMLAAWGAYDLAVTGHPLPNTFYCKTRFRRVGWNLAYLVLSGFLDGGPLPAAAMTLLGIAGVWTVGRRFDARMLLFAPTLVLAGIVLTHGLIPGLTFYQQRYLYPFTILYVPFAGVGFEAILDAASREGRERTVRIGLSIFVLASLLPALVAFRRSYREHCREIELLHTRPALAAAAWLDPGRPIVVEGAGSSRYHLPNEIIDAVGLNDHHIAHALDRPARVKCLILARSPSLLIFPSDWLPEFQPLWDMTVLARFRTVRLSSEGGSDEEVDVVRVRARPEAATLCR